MNIWHREKGENKQKRKAASFNALSIKKKHDSDNNNNNNDYLIQMSLRGLISTRQRFNRIPPS